MFTKLEQQVFNIIAEISMSGSVTDIDDLIADNLTAKQARGVIASLVKKDKVVVDEHKNGFETVIHYWPTTRDGQTCFFWCDELTEDEYLNELIKDGEVRS